MSDSSNGPIYGFAGQLDTASAHAPSIGSPVPLEPGTQQATAQVTVVYAIDRK
jgi:uncharacterized protein YggE